MTSVSVWAFVAGGLGAFISNFLAEWIKSGFRQAQLSEEARDQDLQLILEKVEELRELSSAYWLFDYDDVDPHPILLEAKMVAALHTITITEASLLTDEAKRECDVPLHSAHRAITGDDFKVPGRKARPEQISIILMALSELQRVATTKRRELPRHRFSL